MKIIIRFLILALAVFSSAYIVSGIQVDSYKSAILAGVVLGLVNLILKPIITVITLPINLLTLGLFSVVVNALLLWGITYIVPGFHITTFTAAIIGSLLISLVDSLLRGLTKH